ncbi:phosphotransferase family protein [Streptomyces xanthii]|uniref:Aminoglycoside phosphotransferase family protein n=1 Tax=Streptomyces xanthii TaxID=2768069 RepID=A0A7H1BHK9_9ACTN|nr:aminoglycoside phosphotransferase family protein [Streptomyces xanthii]QNS08214.1 aminoglycoside phosphotransferase family protein [Streptomyces xanthii]
MGRQARAETTDVPAAAGVRVDWWAVPSSVRSQVEASLGAAVELAVTQAGGFSPGVAARVRLADGRRVFVKAVGPEPNPDTPDLHRAEARITAALPATAPVPALLTSLDLEGWVVLVLEDIDGRTPAQPWRPDELHRVLTAAAELSAQLDPSPIQAPTLADRIGEDFRGWRWLAAACEDKTGELSWLAPWARRHLGRLVEREADWTTAAAGSALIHGDLRADNVLLTEDRVVVVDWPWAAVGAAWFDVVAMGPSVIMQGAPDAMSVLDEHLCARGADAEDVTTVLIALAGYFLRHSAKPPPPGLPTLRGFQRAQGEAAVEWVRARTGWR